jgi:hypothetical protein
MKTESAKACDLTVHLVDREGEPTATARDEVLAFFRRRLLA